MPYSVKDILATAAGTAVQASLFALQGITVQATDGIIAASFEETTQNIGELSTQGMIETDRTILRIMLQKRFSGFQPDLSCPSASSHRPGPSAPAKG